MRLPLIVTSRRRHTILAALSATLFASAALHAQATAQPTKTPAPKASAATAAPSQTPATKPTPAAQQTGQTKPAQPATRAAQPATKATNPAAKLNEPIKPNRVYVDINHATLKELKNIPGIGDVYGKKIIAGRPYANKSQLVSRKIIDANLYDTIQGMIIAKQ